MRSSWANCFDPFQKISIYPKKRSKISKEINKVSNVWGTSPEHHRTIWSGWVETHDFIEFGGANPGKRILLHLRAAGQDPGNSSVRDILENIGTTGIKRANVWPYNTIYHIIHQNTSSYHIQIHTGSYRHSLNSSAPETMQAFSSFSSVVLSVCYCSPLFALWPVCMGWALWLHRARWSSSAKCKRLSCCTFMLLGIVLT